MILKTTGRKVALKQNFLAKVEKRMKKFDRFFNEDAEASVTVTVESNRQTVEITVRYRDFIYRAERTQTDMESAFAEAADLIERQIVRNKQKLGNRLKKIEDPVPPEFYDADQEEEEYRVVREKRFDISPMSVDEAILQMNMLGHSFFIFKKDDEGEVCVVYRRHDDGYGLLIPN